MSKKLINSIVLAAGVLLASSSVSAKQIWSDFSLSLLKGSDYEVGDADRDVLTVEHVSGHNWGDSFFFVDRLKSDNGDTETYFELSPRVSLSYLTGSKMSAGIVKDVFIATTWEGGQSGAGGFDNYLVGVGLSLDVPGFQYFDANIYSANNDGGNDDEQLTLTWGVPFSLGTTDFLYDGFIDHTNSDIKETNFTSQLKWNVGKLVKSASPIYLGIEYSYWNNKFAIDGVKEKNVALLLKAHF